MKRANITVESFGGETTTISECRCIHGIYYIKNKECFFLSGKWYRINSGLITLNHETGKYILKSSPEALKLKEGIVGFNGTTPIYGLFSENIYNNVIIYNPETAEMKVAVNVQICKKALLPFNLKIGAFCIPPTTQIGKENLKYKEDTLMESLKHSLSYRAETAIEDALTTFIRYYKVKENHTGLAKYLDFSWGMEFETTTGIVPSYLLHRHGIIPLRDGSIKGLEYATVPLKGERGIQNTLDIISILKEYTTKGFDCAFHIHLGGYERSVKSILALYILGTSIQDDIYSYFPSWFRDTGVYKRRSYVGPLRAVSNADLMSKSNNSENTLFSAIYRWYSGGNSFTSLDTTRHPSDPNGEHKWTVEQRYTWLNIIPLIFSNRGTVEFRIHPPTTNEVKIVNWLLICSAILRYASANQELILKEGYKPITLKTVLEATFPHRICYYLLEYMKSRKNTYKTLENTSDPTCETDILNDLKFNYKSILEII